MIMIGESPTDAATTAPAPSTTARAVFATARQLLNRDWMPLVATWGILWLVWFVPRLLTGALVYGAEWNPGPAHAVIVGAIVAVYAAQIAVAIWLVAGIVLLHLEGDRRSGRAPFGCVFGAGGRMGWLLLLVVGQVLVIAGGIGVAAAANNEGFSDAVHSAFLVLLVLLVPALATQSVALPLIVDRRLNTFSAMAGSARALFRRGHLTHLLVIAVAAAGTLAMAVASLWPVRSGDDPFEVGWVLGPRAVFGILTRTNLDEAALVASIGVAGCFVATPLIVALYLRLCDPAPAHADTAAPTSAPRLRRPLVGLAAAALLSLGLAYGAVWAFNGIDSIRTLPSGQRVTLHSGLSLIPPDGSRLTEYRRYPSWLPLGENAPVSADGNFYPVGIYGRRDSLFLEEDKRLPMFLIFESCFSEDAWLLHRSQREPVLGSNSDGTVVIRGKADSRIVNVDTHLPGSMIGVLWVRLEDGGKADQAWTAQRQNAALARLWRDLQIEGVALPTIP